MAITDRFKRSWNAFLNRGPGAPEQELSASSFATGVSSSIQPYRTRMRRGNERSIINSIYTRLSMDLASVDIKHIRVGENDRFKSTIDSGLNYCLMFEANVDQTATPFRHDMAMTMFETGHLAIVAVDTSADPDTTGSYDVLTLRVGTVTQWYPRHVTVSVYNDRTGLREEITIEKSQVAIIENPLYSVMNETNSTLHRLISKINMLDDLDAQTSSGKLDILVQLPYALKSEARKQEAENRRKSIEEQLAGAKYGIAYIDSTESVTQLNRPAENNLLKQIEYLTNQLYAQLGLTPAIFDGTADEEAMLNYHNRTIAPILQTWVESIQRTFLTRTAVTQGQRIRFFRDPFKLVPVGKMAEIADKFTRNEILSSNEIRGIIGFHPSDDPKADKLINSNLNQANESDTDLGELKVVDDAPKEIE